MLARARSSFRQMEDVANWVNDMPAEWWPFEFLRPRPEQRMTTLRVLLVAALYGVFVGMLANVILIAGGHTAGLSVFSLPGYTTLSFFVVFRTTFAYFWNRRAERLAVGISVGRD